MVTPLHAWNVDRYAAMVAASLRHWLSQLGSDGPVLAFGCSDEDTPAGVVLVVENPPDVDINWVYVLPSKRQRGFGDALLEAVEQWARARHRRALLMTRPIEPASAALQTLLERRGWSIDGARLLVATLSASSMARSRWCERWTRKPVDIFAWSDLTAAERHSLEESLPPDDPLSPFRHELGSHAQTSLAMRRNGEVVGWLLTHPAGPKTVQYSLLGVRPDLRGHGGGFALAAACARQQILLDGEDALGVLAASTSNVAMMKLLAHGGGLHPHVATLRQASVASKLLAQVLMLVFTATLATGSTRVPGTACVGRPFPAAFAVPPAT